MKLFRKPYPEFKPGMDAMQHLAEINRVHRHNRTVTELRSQLFIFLVAVVVGVPIAIGLLTR